MPENRCDQGYPKQCERCGNNAAKLEAEAALSPLSAACALAEFIREEHGTWGVRQFLSSLACLVPYDMIEQLAQKWNVCAPPRPIEPVPPPPVPKQEKPSGMSPEQLLLMMNAFGGQKSEGGLDPAMLMQLMKK